MKTLISNKKNLNSALNLNVNGNFMTNQQIVANLLSNNVINIGPNLKKKVKKYQFKYFYDYLKSPNHKSIFFSPVTSGDRHRIFDFKIRCKKEN